MMNSVGNPMLWGAFAVVVVIMLAFDLLLQGRKGAQVMTMKSAAVWSLVWIGLSLLFNVGFWWYLNNSLNGSSGNAQANIAAGDGNQQDNQTAIAAGDAATVFALGTITQDNHNNTSIQVATHNNASLNNSANGSSGNLGVNAASGNFNQQKNQLAIATASGAAAAASSNTTQTSVDNTFLNTVATQSGHWGSSTYLPVVNNASANNSLNGSSGNLGANIAAGVGNQQGNTTVISSGVRF